MSTESDSLERRDIHILVVDDDDRIRSLLQKYLAKAGFRVSAASDAAEARRKMDGLAFDLLILDVMMPGEDGFALTRSLREHNDCLLYTSPSPRDGLLSRMPSSA